MRGRAAAALALLAALAAGAPAAAKNALVPFATSPFPYDGIIPDKGIPFLDADVDGRRGHTSPRGGIRWLDETYSDRRVLLSIPPAFNPRKPAAMVVFFHGNGATLSRDVADRQRVPAQLAASGLNAVLVAPQFAVDAQDSSAGRFWQPGAFAAFVEEAGRTLKTLYGRKPHAEALERLPVVIVAYSGGYLPAAYSLAVGGLGERVRGVVLLDALYGQSDMFQAWIVQRRPPAFFFSAYSDSSRPGNEALQSALVQAGVVTLPTAGADLAKGNVVFLDAGKGIDHAGFVTQGWTRDPLAWVLHRIKAGLAAAR